MALPLLTLETVRADPIYVMLTVDVETRSTGTAERDIWGILPDSQEPLGIGYIMTRLESVGARGTFFVNVYETPQLGQEEMRRICWEIVSRGHDIELHTHPQGTFPGLWYLGCENTEQQVEIIGHGKRLMEEFSGRRVLAHRAGSFSASLGTLEACRQLDVPMDFSANRAMEQCFLADDLENVNAPRLANGVIAVPVTCYHMLKLGPLQIRQYLDTEHSTPQETLAVIRDLRDHGVASATIVMHSFSLVRRSHASRRALGEFEQLLADLSAEPGVKLVSADQFHQAVRQRPELLEAGEYVPTTGLWLSYRHAWSRLDEGWKNPLAALGPLAFVFLAATGILLWRRRRRQRRLEVRQRLIERLEGGIHAGRARQA